MGSDTRAIQRSNKPDRIIKWADRIISSYASIDENDTKFHNNSMHITTIGTCRSNKNVSNNNDKRSQIQSIRSKSRLLLKKATKNKEIKTSK